MPPKTLITHSDFFNEYNGLQNQILYLIISLNTASIGYALTRLESQTLSIKIFPLVLSILCWTVSIIMAFLFIQRKKQLILLEIEQLDSDELVTDQIEKEQIRVLLTRTAIRHQAGMVRFYNFMTWLFVGGLLCYAFWISIRLID